MFLARLHSELTNAKKEFVNALEEKQSLNEKLMSQYKELLLQNNLQQLYDQSALPESQILSMVPPHVCSYENDTMYICTRGGP